MLNGRNHAAVDLGVAASLLGLALLPGSAVRVRALAAAVAIGQAGLMAVTDYEGGIAPLLSFRQHRRIDLAASALVAAAGAAWRSPALFAAAAATGAAAWGSDTHAHHAPSMLYRPLDTPKPFAPDVWLVDGAIGPGVPVRMTVIRLPDGTLLLHSPTRFSAVLQHRLEAIGPIRHLVAPNSVHWVFAKAWQDAVPEAATYAAPGLRERGQVRRAGLRIDHVLSADAPTAWGGAMEQVVVPGGAGFREVAMFHRPSGTVLMTDLVQNFEPAKLPWLLRPVARLLGNAAPTSRAPGHLRLVMLFRQNDAAAAARRIVGWAPERIVVTHGAPIERDATARLRRSFGWLI